MPEVGRLLRLVRLVLGLLALERCLLCQEGALRGAQLIHGGGDVAHRDAAVLTGRLGSFATPGEQRGVSAGGLRAGVHIGVDRLVTDAGGLCRDQLLVLTAVSYTHLTLPT